MPPDAVTNLTGTIGRLVHLLALDTGERIFAIDEDRALRQSRTETEQRAPTAVAIIALQGALRPRGYASMETFRGKLMDSAANPDVGAIVLDIDSPGGTYSGTPETAAAVQQVAQTKPVIAVVDSLAASAAYWIASQATQIVASPSSEVGSIGVICLHLEISKALADFGVTPTIMRSVPNKAEGSMFEPLSEDAKAHIMSQVADAHGEFVRAVAQGRRVAMTRVSDEFGRGRTVSAQKAVELGMADKIGTMSDVLSGLRTKSGTIRRRAAFTF